jgi:hypothetical protein
MSGNPPLTLEEILELQRQFAAPLAHYALSLPARREGAEFMVKTLWTVMMAGPEMEEATWKAFREIGGIQDEDLKAIQDCYYQQMKPVVSEEQVVALRRRYGLKRKKE